jgi:hypothetical protein
MMQSLVDQVDMVLAESIAAAAREDVANAQ